VIIVLTLGLLLSLFNSDIGIGISLRVPFTDSNVTAAGSVGKKEHASAVLPAYARGHLGSNQDFINQSTTLTIWVAEGTALVLVARQPGSPLIDLHIEAR
jgi:hypothetical protein